MGRIRGRENQKVLVHVTELGEKTGGRDRDGSDGVRLGVDSTRENTTPETKTLETENKIKEEPWTTLRILHCPFSVLVRHPGVVSCVQVKLFSETPIVNRPPTVTSVVPH